MMSSESKMDKLTYFGTFDFESAKALKSQEEKSIVYVARCGTKTKSIWLKYSFGVYQLVPHQFIEGTWDPLPCREWNLLEREVLELTTEKEMFSLLHRNAMFQFRSLQESYWQDLPSVAEVMRTLTARPLSSTLDMMRLRWVDDDSNIMTSKTGMHIATIYCGDGDIDIPCQPIINCGVHAMLVELAKIRYTSRITTFSDKLVDQIEKLPNSVGYIFRRLYGKVHKEKESCEQGREETRESYHRLRSCGNSGSFTASCSDDKQDSGQETARWSD